MRKVTGMLLLVIFVQPVFAGAVYRCVGARGEISYSDVSCPGRGVEVPQSTLNRNLYTPGPMAEFEPTREESGSRAYSTRRSCNPATDLRHIDMMLDSLGTDNQQRKFLLAERRRVANCELDEFSTHDRNLRDAALNRTGDLKEGDRLLAQHEVEDLYPQYRSSHQSEYRSGHPKKRYKRAYR